MKNLILVLTILFTGIVSAQQSYTVSGTTFVISGNVSDTALSINTIDYSAADRLIFESPITDVNAWALAIGYQLGNPILATELTIPTITALSEHQLVFFQGLDYDGDFELFRIYKETDGIVSELVVDRITTIGNGATVIVDFPYEIPHGLTEGQTIAVLPAE